MLYVSFDVYLIMCVWGARMFLYTYICRDVFVRTKCAIDNKEEDELGELLVLVPRKTAP